MAPPHLHAARPACRRSRVHAARARARRALAGAGILLVSLVVGGPAEPSRPGGPDTDSPQRTKAHHLASFTKFVTWPESAFDGPKAPFVVAVLGEDPLGSALDESFEGCKVGEHEVVVRRYPAVEKLGTCHLLFVPKGEAGKLAKVVARLGDASVLLVGESEGFALHGGILNFYEEKSAIRFEINPSEAHGRRLVVSSKLLELARIVGSKRVPRRP